jgi:hypothetical protein
MIDAYKDRFGVEPICRVLEVPTSTYYARTRRPPSTRAARDAALLERIRQVHQANYQAMAPGGSGSSSTARVSRLPAAPSSG